jgi:hypothetical protein
MCERAIEYRDYFTAAVCAVRRAASITEHPLALLG